MNNTRLFYLHGFSSSPGSKKGQYLRHRFSKQGVELVLPDLNRPTFETLTLSAQIDEMEHQLMQLPSGCKAALIGSSMGALIACLVADKLPDRIDRMALVAPAFQFVGHRLAALAGCDLETWQTKGWIPMQHYADEKTHRLVYLLVEDASKYDFKSLQVRHPTCVIHGTRDELIPIDATREWTQTHQNITLHALPGGTHDLAEHLDDVWTICSGFLLDSSV